MAKTNVYSHTIQTGIRIISLVAIIILVISNTLRIETYDIKQLISMHYEFFSFIINCITTILFFIIIMYPTKLGLLSIIPFLYGSLILIFEPQNNMGILMFGLSIITLYARGFFNKLDIQKIAELNKRDAEWLADIINGEKYESLAIKYHMSLGSVKNRLKVIFDEIGVGDKQGFLNKYSDYEICYGDDFSSKKKKKLFNI